MILFYILAGVTAGLAALLVLAAARRGADRIETLAAPLAHRELAELDRLKTRGLLDDDAWREARAEAGRRLLAPGPEPVRLSVGRNDDRVVLIALGVTAATALGLYLVVGSSGLPDAPYARRVDAWSNTLDQLEPEQVAAVVGRVVERNPQDHRALTMLGAARFQAGNSIGAASAFRRALKLQPEDAQSWARLGESLVRSQDGDVGPDAEAAFRRALALDTDQLGARFFLGDAALKQGDLAAAEGFWRPLINALEPSDERRIELEQRLATADAGLKPK